MRAIIVFVRCGCGGGRGLAQQNRLEPCFRGLAGGPDVVAGSCSEVEWYPRGIDGGEEAERWCRQGWGGRDILRGKANVYEVLVLGNCTDVFSYLLLTRRLEG